MMVDLIMTLDDATGWINLAIFVEEEGTMSSFLGLGETIRAMACLVRSYTHRGSHYSYTPEAGGAGDKARLT
jgi:hypothetical protein